MLFAKPGVACEEAGQTALSSQADLLHLHLPLPAGAVLLEVQLDLHALLDEGRIVAAFAAAVEAAGDKLKLAVLDHVISFPPVVLPVKRLTRMCRCVMLSHVLVASDERLCVLAQT